MSPSHSTFGSQERSQNHVIAGGLSDPHFSLPSQYGLQAPRPTIEDLYRDPPLPSPPSGKSPCSTLIHPRLHRYFKLGPNPITGGGPSQPGFRTQFLYRRYIATDVPSTS